MSKKKNIKKDEAKIINGENPIKEEGFSLDKDKAVDDLLKKEIESNDGDFSNDAIQSELNPDKKIKKSKKKKEKNKKNEAKDKKEKKEKEKKDKSKKEEKNK